LFVLVKREEEKAVQVTRSKHVLLDCYSWLVFGWIVSCFRYWAHFSFQ